MKFQLRNGTIVEQLYQQRLWIYMFLLFIVSGFVCFPGTNTLKWNT